MLKRLFLVTAAALTLAASALAFASCKSNDITQNNNTDEYDSFVTQAAAPDQQTTILGPDGSKVVIEAHALAASTTITIGKMKAGSYPDLPTGWASSGGVYSFEPHNQGFAIPVHITVPYVDMGQPIRLATASPGGRWSPVDGVALSGGTVTFDSPHFSFYTVVTGAPVDTTRRDSGVDASIPDATTQDSPADAPQEAEAAAPPPPPTVFLATANNLVYRYFAIDPDADGGADAGGLDGGSRSIAKAGPMAMETSPFTLFVGQTAATDGGGVTTIADPFGAFTLGASFPGATPGALDFINGELWLLNPATSKLETYVGGVKNWSSTQTITGNAFAYDRKTSTIYVLDPLGPSVKPFTIGNADAGAGKTLTPLTVWNNLIASAPSAIAVTPWDEVIIGGTGVYRYKTTGQSLPTYGNVNTQSVAGIGAVRWPSGRDELFFADTQAHGALRYTFAPLDTTHTTAIANGVITPPGAQIPSGMVVAP